MHKHPANLSAKKKAAYISRLHKSSRPQVCSTFADRCIHPPGEAPPPLQDGAQADLTGQHSESAALAGQAPHLAILDKRGKRNEAPDTAEAATVLEKKPIGDMASELMAKLDGKKADGKKAGGKKGKAMKAKKAAKATASIKGGTKVMKSTKLKKGAATPPKEKLKKLAFPGIPKKRRDPMQMGKFRIYTDMHGSGWRAKEEGVREDTKFSWKVPVRANPNGVFYVRACW